MFLLPFHIEDPVVEILAGLGKEDALADRSEVRQNVTEDQAGVTDISQISHGLRLVLDRKKNSISQSVIGVERDIYLY